MLKLLNYGLYFLNMFAILCSISSSSYPPPPRRRISWTMCSMKRCTSCFVSIFCFLSSFCRLSIVFSDCLGKAGQSVTLQRMLAMCLFSGRSNIHGFKRAWSGLLKPITVILGFFTSGFVSGSIHLSMAVWLSKDVTYRCIFNPLWETQLYLYNKQSTKPSPMSKNVGNSD